MTLSTLVTASPYSRHSNESAKKQNAKALFRCNKDRELCSSFPAADLFREERGLKRLLNMPYIDLSKKNEIKIKTLLIDSNVPVHRSHASADT